MAVIDNATGETVPEDAPKVLRMPDNKDADARRAKIVDRVRRKGLAAAQAADDAVNDAKAAATDAVDAGAKVIDSSVQAVGAIGNLGLWILAGVAVAFFVFGESQDES